MLLRRAACLQVATAVLAMLPLAPGLPAASFAQAAPPAISVKAGPDGRLVYASDARGNRVVDFSHAGYRGGGRPIPDVAVRLVVGAGGGNDRARIQAAIDIVATQPLDAAGHRGAVLLEPGTYRIDTQIRIGASGVVLRGSGQGEDGTRLVATGTSRRSPIVVSGTGGRRDPDARPRAITDAYVPVGATSLRVEDASGLSAGTRVIVRRPSTAAWIAALGMNTFPGWRPENRLHWQPGSRDLSWDRVITAIEGDRVTLDAPITTAIDADYGGGTVSRHEFAGRIAEAGVEHLRLESAYDRERPWDEDHAWEAITLDKVEDAWVRQVTALHFAGSVINVLADARAITVEDVEAREPISEVGGYRRRVFYTAGQQTLFQRCRSERGKHDFVVGHAAGGPTVFLDVTTSESFDYSGPLESWASGVLLDNVVVRGNAIRFVNRDVADQGAGWAAANSVIWNCEATDVEVQSPPGAFNQAYGCKGVVTGDGIVYDPRSMPYRDFYRGMPVAPRSLYLAQLEERLGAAGMEATKRRAIPVANGGARRLSEADVEAFTKREEAAATGLSRSPLKIEHGAFTIGGHSAWTSRTSYSWFQAQMPPAVAPTFGPAITRFAPGRVGRGHTDDLREVVAEMKPGGVFYQHYGLWYDRRRVNHNYYGSPERRTGDVWAPFMELPWARSGQGKAWDGLSKYDLTRFNPWYFERLRSFADLADREGRVLYYAFYFQHWLLESRSHYVDFPWRPVNTIQDTGLPDEVPAANVFYDLSYPLRRDLHRLYIRKVLDVLGTHGNVVFGIDREYTGSIEFLRFWLDEIAAWQQDTGRKVFVSLEVPKDQLDAVLADPLRATLVSAMDVHGWVYRADGHLFAIRGGVNRAPREQRPDIATPGELEALKQTLGPAALDQSDFRNGPEFQRLFDTLWASSPAMKYRAWREYRDRHPELVVLTPADVYPDLTRAIESTIPAAARRGLAPTSLVRAPRESAWCVARTGDALLVYSVNGAAVDLDLTQEAVAYDVQWVLTSAASNTPASRVAGGAAVKLSPPAGSSGPWAAWLTRAR